MPTCSFCFTTPTGVCPQCGVNPTYHNDINPDRCRACHTANVNAVRIPAAEREWARQQLRYRSMRGEE